MEKNNERRKRGKLALSYVIIALSVTAILGGLLSLIAKNFIFVTQYIFWLFSAFMIVAAFLLLVTNLKEELCYIFGAGSYYGALAIAAITEKLNWYMPDEARIVISAVISSLICYIVYLTKYKRRDED